MDYRHYNDFADKIRQHKTLLKCIHFLNILITAAGFIMYPALLVFYLRQIMTGRLLVTILVPGIAFAAVSVFRKVLNVPRPYELYPIRPLISKDKKGESFPSRHTFSIMLIAGLWFYQYPPVGIILFLCGAVLALIRVLGGVHFLKDVIWGTILGTGTAAITALMLFLLFPMT